VSGAQDTRLESPPPARGRVAIVTGGAGGIGRATAARLASDGFKVAVWDADAAGAEAVAAGLRNVANAAGAVAIACDVGDPSSVQAAAQRTRDALGAPWALVNNAGIDRFSLFKDSDPADWAAIVRVNLFGTLHCTKAVVDDMIEAAGGRIVCISSDAARVGSSGEGVYAASKAGVLGFMKTLAREVARYGVCVNAICPGPVDTALLDAVRRGPKGDKIIDAMCRAVPMGRIARPDDIAGVVAFFLSPDAAYVTGQTLSVSGGLTMA
jgi:2-hydroxycyclohexanecarboxyl-CoA dehydrogenase